MARPSKFSAEKKQQIVMSVLRGEVTLAEAGRRLATSETTIAKWRDQFVQGGVSALQDGARSGPSGREVELEQRVEDLTSALGEAHVELRLLRRGGAAGFATRSLR